MKVTISAIKADIGAIAGHICPSPGVVNAVSEFVKKNAKNLLIDYYVGYCGDDIHILMTHQKGVGNKEIHGLAWEAFKAGTAVAKAEGLYGAGQDLLKDSFSGNVRGLGPGVAEMEIEERPAEPFLFFAADKTEPGAFNLPLYLAFADPMYSPGLMLSSTLAAGFSFTIMDVNYTEGDRVITLNAPEDLYDIAALLRDNHRFVIESIRSRKTARSPSSAARRDCITSRAVCGQRRPGDARAGAVAISATGEVVAPFEIAHYVAGDCRGSHNVPLMPVKRNSTIGYFDGPAMVQCLGFSVKDGKLIGPVDIFDHPYWDWVREKAARKMSEIRRQGFSGPAMVGMEELEYGGIAERLRKLEEKFSVRK
jgi:fructose 1,6-bisphosphate aldolase/phosphatase